MLCGEVFIGTKPRRLFLVRSANDDVLDQSALYSAASFTQAA